MVGDARLVHYLPGFWARQVHSRVAAVECDATTRLVMPAPTEQRAGVDEVIGFESDRAGTLVNHPMRVALTTTLERLSHCHRLGGDAIAAGWLAPHASVTPADDLLLELRRHEDADEVALIRRALDAAQAWYAWARAALDASTDEVTLHAGMLGAATAHTGETLREFGDDFQIGTLGSEPRRRRARAGEIAILDATVTLCGYRADMCRPFAVDRRPSTVQVNVRRRIVDAFDRIERTIAPGARCRELDRDIRGMLHGHHGWTFEHHLGHGIGLAAHEAPRINQHWDDTFQVGDLVAVEPGRYGGDFYAGLRIEQVYYVSETGLERLTSFPTDLT